MRQFYGFILSILALSMGTISCGNDDDPQEETIVGPQVTVTMTDARKEITVQNMSIPYHELKVSQMERLKSHACCFIFMEAQVRATTMKSRWKSQGWIPFPII